MGEGEAFGWAIKQMHNGSRVRRVGWNGKGMFLFLVADWQPTNVAAVAADKYPRLPFIAMKTADEKMVPWLASQTDMLAVDWEMAE